MRYLLQSQTGKVLAYTDLLAKRADMTEVSESVAKAILANKPAPVAEEDARLPGPKAPPSEPAQPTEPAVVEQNEAATIMAFDDKVDLEQFARAKGLELDRRKSLANLKQETLQHLGYSVEG